MKRILIFGLLGPVLSLVVLCLPAVIKSPREVLHVFLSLAPFVLPLAFGLMGIAGLIDRLFSGMKWVRIAASAAAGYVAVIIFQYVTGPLVMLSLGLVGAIPAGLCSWLLTDRQTKPRPGKPTQVSFDYANEEERDTGRSNRNKQRARSSPPRSVTD